MVTPDWWKRSSISLGLFALSKIAVWFGVWPFAKRIPSPAMFNKHELLSPFLPCFDSVRIWVVGEEQRCCRNKDPFSAQLSAHSVPSKKTSRAVRGIYIYTIYIYIYVHDRLPASSRTVTPLTEAPQGQAGQPHVAWSLSWLGKDCGQVTDWARYPSPMIARLLPN